MKKALFLLLAAMTAVAGAPSAHACTIGFSGNGASLSYDPFVSTPAFEDFSVTLTFAPECGAGDAVVYFSDTFATPLPGRLGAGRYTVPYQLTRSGSDVLRTSMTGLEGTTVAVDAPATVTTTFRLAIPSGQRVAAGSKTIRIGVVPPVGGLVESNFTLTLGLTEVRRLYLAGSSVAGEALFQGALAPGVSTAPVLLYPQSTRPFRIAVASENGGVLRHWSGTQYLGGADEADRTFAYDLRIGGQAVPASGGAYIDSTDYQTQPMDPVSGDPIPVQATVSAGQPPGQRRAGLYRDVITFTIEPLS